MARNSLEKIIIFSDYAILNILLKYHNTHFLVCSGKEKKVPKVRLQHIYIFKKKRSNNKFTISIFAGLRVARWSRLDGIGESHRDLLLPHVRGQKVGQHVNVLLSKSVERKTHGTLVRVLEIPQPTVAYTGATAGRIRLIDL